MSMSFEDLFNEFGYVFIVFLILMSIFFTASFVFASPLDPIGPMPPDIFGWIIIIVIVIIVVGGIFLLLQYTLEKTHSAKSTYLTSRTSGTEYTKLENIMTQLLEEIKLLRKEISDLRRELNE